MKNLLVFCSFFFALSFFTSCNKDYTCTCTIGGVETATEYTGVKKSDAETACDLLQTAAQVGDPDASCTLN